MNPFTLIGLFLVIFCGIKHVNAIPIASDSAISAENRTSVLDSDEKLYNTTDTSKSLENVEVVQLTVAQTTQKPKSKTRRRIKRRKASAQPDYRQTTAKKPSTPKAMPLRSYLPHIFVTQNWGPGR